MACAAACTLIEQQGLAGLSARKVARAIGYTVGTLYLVFRNLDELILWVNASTLDELHQELLAARDAASGDTERILALAHAYIDFAERQPKRWSAVFDHRLPEGEPLPAWFQDRIERLFGLAAETLEPLTAAGLSSRRRAAGALWSGIHGICILAVGGKLDVADDTPPTRLVDFLVRTFVAGLQAKRR
jgi:AcrR family transcriptional regulator